MKWETSQQLHVISATKSLMKLRETVKYHASSFGHQVNKVKNKVNSLHDTSNIVDVPTLCEM